MSLKHFALVDTTLREGEQFFKANFSTAQKKAIAREVSEFGVEYIELTSPAASPRSEQVCRAISRMGLSAKILTHIRCCKADAQKAIDAGVAGISFFYRCRPFQVRARGGKTGSASWTMSWRSWK